MQLRNSRRRWGAVSRALHWLIAAAVITMMALGWVATWLPYGALKVDVFWVHKSLGILVLLAMGLRLLWRLAKPVSGPVPPLPDGLKPWERRAAKLTHVGFYGLLIAMPLSGWVINSAANFPLSVFGWFELPPLVGPDENVQDIASTVHLVLFWLITATLALHIGAALKHHFVLKDRVLRRMLPFGSIKDDR